MQDLFIEFLPPWVETGLQPAFYDRESGTVLQQTARMYAKVNELVKAVNGMDKIIKEYVEYIDNYFKNLDVQEEINNKLDDMAESGDLATTIAQFLAVAPVFGYATISDMESATNLQSGSIARVIGNSTASDGNGAFYIVRAKESGESADGVIKVAIGDTLIADRITDAGLEALADKEEADIEKLTSAPINVKFYGAKGDGVTDDSGVIQQLADANPRKTLYFPEGNYLMRNGLRINHGKPICIKMEKNTVLFTDTPITCMIDMGVDRDPDDHFHVTADDYIQYIDGGIINCENVTIGIRNQSSSAHMYINGTRLNNVGGYGIYCDRDEYYNTSGSHITDVNIDGVTSAQESTGIYLKGFDNKLNNISIIGVKDGVNCEGAGNYVNFVHVVAGYTNDNIFTAEQFNATRAFISSNNDNTFVNCYADTCGTGFDIHSQGHQTITGCFTYWWQAPTEAELYCVKFDSDDVWNPNAVITNCNFSIPNRSNIHCIYAPHSTLYLQLGNNYYSSYFKETDLAFNLTLNGKTNAMPFITPETEWTIGNNYLLGYIQRGSNGRVNFTIKYANASYYDVSIPYTYNSVAFYAREFYHTSSSAFKLIICDETTYDGRTFAKLVVQPVGDGAGWSAFQISNVGGDGLFIREYKSKTPITITDIVDQHTFA